jgi:hypothetical protein
VLAMRELRERAWQRQDGICAVTGLPLDWERDDLHHRLAGQMGGTSQDRDRLSNVVAVLAVAHNLGSPGLPVDGVPGRSVHGDPGWSRPLGLLLSAGRGDDPAVVPVRMARTGWVFLDDAGGWMRVR